MQVRYITHRRNNIFPPKLAMAGRLNLSSPYHLAGRARHGEEERRARQEQGQGQGEEERQGGQGQEER